MGTWYTIGVCAGLGVALAVSLSGALAATRRGLAVAAVLAAAGAAGVALVLFSWPQAVAAAVGATLGALGAAPVVRGTLQRGGTRGGTAALVVVAALVLALLALIPVAGYVEAVALPALAARLRRRGGARYAGLRVLARD